MSRFGDFTLLEDLGQSATADRYKATHATLGGPFFLKVFRRLDPGQVSELAARGDRLIGQSHPNLAAHLGHGVVDGTAFVVSPWLEGLDLNELSASLKDRRVHLSLDQCLLILGDLSGAVTALHAIAPSPSGSRLAHGDVSLVHVRVGPDGQVWLTGLTTPRGLAPGKFPEARFDLAGVGALLYDLVPLLRGGAARPPLPTVLDRVIRRALGIGPAGEHLTTAEFTSRLGEVFGSLKLNPDRAPLVDVIRRTMRAVEKKLIEQGGRPGGKSAADAIPELTPFGGGAAVLEPFERAPVNTNERTRPAVPLPVSTPPSLLTQPPSGEFLTGSAARTGAPSSPSPSMPLPLPLPASSPQTATSLANLRPSSPPPPPGARSQGLPSTSTPSPFLIATPPSLFGPPGLPSHGTQTVDPFAAMPRAPSSSLPSPVPSLGHFDLPGRPAMPLADRDDSRPARAAPAWPPSTLPPPPLTTPPQPMARPVVNSALNERTDPDATRPMRITIQKSLPAVQVLLQARVVRPDQVELAATEQASRGGRTLEILVAHGACTDATVADALAAAAQRPRLHDDVIVVKDMQLLRRLPQTYALARRLLPLALDGGTLILAVADPFDQKVIDEVRDLVHAIGVDVRVTARAALTHATLRAFADLSGGALTATGPRILLGIQDDDLASKLGARLVQEGMQVEHVVDGVTARQILQSRPPDALICTWNLPKVDGQALLLAARNAPRTLELPVFVIGPRGDDDLMAKVLDLGADDYFNDPVRPDVVVAKLRRAVGKLVARPSQPLIEAAPPPPPLLPRKASVAAPLAPSDDFAFDDLPDLPPEFDLQEPELPSMPTGVMGSLRQMALPEIVQSLEMGRKTASVDIVPQDGDKGSIAFEGGAVRFAESGNLVGDQAFFALMRHKDGFFRIHYGDEPKSINIDSPTTFLLLEAMRLMDEEGIS